MRSFANVTAPGLGLVVWAASCLCAPAVGRAQGILNTERFQLHEVAGFHAGVDLSVSGALGNTRLVNAATTGIVGVRSERHWPRLIGGGRFLADRERKLLDDHFVQLRYGYVFSPATQTFHFLQYQANRSLLLRSRWLAGSGIRRTLAAGDRTAVHLGLGIMYEEEHRNRERLEPEDDVVLRTVRGAHHAVITHRFGANATLVNITYVQPSLRDPANIRLLNDLGLQVPIADQLRLGVTLEWRHDSRPPAALRRDDVTLSTGVAVEVR